MRLTFAFVITVFGLSVANADLVPPSRVREPATNVRPNSDEHSFTNGTNIAVAGIALALAVTFGGIWFVRQKK